ncbi:MAG: adenylate/guanylate cyclase domain-containing protein [Bdellovibrionales bacterium]|nr:adenylate/guanylate cyclase domain-containing protein [Bdellovibrionales bacterium]
MLKNILKFSGMFIIVLFCTTSIFFATINREMRNSELKNLTGYSSFFEDRFYDWRMRKTLDKKRVAERIVLLEIDDESLKKIGRWPFSREVWANVVQKLTKLNAKIIAFDIFFSEPEKRFEGKSPDDLFSNAIKRFQTKRGSKVILPYGVTLSSKDSFKNIPDSMLDFMLKAKQAKGINLFPSYLSKSVYPLETLLKASPALGFIRAEKDGDGVFRMYPLVANINGIHFASFPVIIYQAYMSENAVIDLSDSEEKYLVTDYSYYNINFKGETKVRWLGGRDQFQRISVSDFLNESSNKDLRDLFENKIVFIGSTAYGAHDLRNTPIKSDLPGVYFHMNMTHMMLDGKHFRPSGKSTYLSWIILLGTSFLMIFIMTFQSATLDILVAIAMTSGLLFADIYYLTPEGFEVKLFFCLLSILACYLWGTTVEFYATTKEKKKIRNTFRRFISPDVVDDMLTHPEHAKVGSTSKVITVFFSDIRNFTEVAAKLKPDELSSYLNQYMGKMTDIIFNNKGTLDKYIGDAIVAFWGAPIEIKDHAYRSICASLEMIETLPTLNEEYLIQGLPAIEHGIGLNTGMCSVGNMGSDNVISYTAIGEHMNLGSRLEKLCKHYGIRLHVSEFTLASLTEEQLSQFQFRPIDRLKLTGKEIYFNTYEILDRNHLFYNRPDDINTYEKGFHEFREQRPRKAVKILEPLLEKYPADTPLKILVENCRYALRSRG